MFGLLVPDDAQDERSILPGTTDMLRDDASAGGGAVRPQTCRRVADFYRNSSSRIIQPAQAQATQMFSDLSQSPLRKNLQRLFLLRNIVIAAQCLTLGLAYWILEMNLPWAEMVTVAVLLAVLNLATWLRLRRKWPVSSVEFFGQLVMDVFALSALLYFSGGSTNPFISLYLLPLTIAAAA